MFPAIAPARAAASPVRALPVPRAGAHVRSWLGPRTSQRGAAHPACGRSIFLHERPPAARTHGTAATGKCPSARVRVHRSRRFSAPCSAMIAVPVSCPRVAMCARRPEMLADPVSLHVHVVRGVPTYAP